MCRLSNWCGLASFRAWIPRGLILFVAVFIVLLTGLMICAVKLLRRVLITAVMLIVFDARVGMPVARLVWYFCWALLEMRAREVERLRTREIGLPCLR